MQIVYNQEETSTVSKGGWCRMKRRRPILALHCWKNNNSHRSSTTCRVIVGRLDRGTKVRSIFLPRSQTRCKSATLVRKNVCKARFLFLQPLHLPWC